MTRWTARSAKSSALIGSALSVGLILAGCSSTTSNSIASAAPTSYVGPAGNCAGKATNILVLATFWLNYASVRGDKDEQESIRLGIVQVMMMVSPFMRDEERLHLNTLSQAYLR